MADAERHALPALAGAPPAGGALEALEAQASFRAPHLADIERAMVAGLARAGSRGRVFADLWDLERFAECRACLERRRARLQAMNLEQRAFPPTACDTCGGALKQHGGELAPEDIRPGAREQQECEKPQCDGSFQPALPAKRP